MLLQYSQAQNANNLSYSQIDSLLEVYENQSIQGVDKGISLALEASQISGKQDSISAIYLGKAALFYGLKGNKEKTIQGYQKTLEAFAKATGVHSSSYTLTLNGFGTFYQKIGNFDQARLLFTQAMNIQEKTIGKMNHEFALSLTNLADLYQETGNYDKALPLLIQVNNILEKVLGKLHSDFAVSLNNLATLHKRMGNFDKALPLLIQTNNILEKTIGKMHYLFAFSLNNLAVLHKNMGNYDKALLLLVQSNNILKNTFGKFHPAFASSLNGLATLHKNMGNFDQALLLHTQALNIRAKTLGKQHPSFAASLNNLATLHNSMGNVDQARSLHIQALNIRAKTFGKQHPSFTASLNNLAILHQTIGNFDQAWIYALQAIKSCSKITLSMTISPLWIDSLLNASFASNLHLENTITTLNTIFNLLQEDTTVYDAPYKQIILTDLATALLAKLRNNLSNDKDKLRLLAQSSLWLQRSLKCLHTREHNSKAFALADQNKSVLLHQASKSEKAYRLGHLPNALILTDKKLLKKQSQLQARLIEKRSEGEKDSLINELNHVNQDIDDFLQMIKSDYPKYYKLKYLQVDTKVANIQKLLDDKTALLEYVISDSIVHIFFVYNKQVSWKKIPISKDKLTQRIQNFHRVLSNYKIIAENNCLSYKIYTEQAHWFYQKLIAPVLANKKNIKNLILITDGELGHLPFETFLVEQAPQEVTNYNQLHYLVTDYNISYNYSASLWKENMEAPAPKNNGQILGVAANYDIQLDSSMMEIRLPTDQWLREILEPLPNARKEVEALQEKYQGFFAFDLLASEKMVKQKAGDFAILHFATHGILDTKRPILSSLAFTEDNDSIESNFWQAHEISKMQLNANLVVLSACETGFGKFEKGNGIASLARSFMYAGAPSLIVSLWQVNDYATSEIMKNFYENLANGMKVDQALRQAKLQYMKTAVGIMAHPAFWSPFIQIGKTQPISIKTKGGGLMLWIIGGAIFLLIFVGGFAISRRNRETT
jgi:CHAT domain-containing protein/Flp pilus assembly protein TadD